MKYGDNKKLAEELGVHVTTIYYRYKEGYREKHLEDCKKSNLKHRDRYLKYQKDYYRKNKNEM